MSVYDDPQDHDPSYDDACMDRDNAIRERDAAIADLVKVVNECEPRFDEASRADHAVRYIREVEKQRDAAEKRCEALEKEIQTLRLYGNKDCTAMADKALATKDTP